VNVDATSDSANASIGQERTRGKNPRPLESGESPAVKGPVTSIAVVDDNWFTRECISRSLKELDRALNAIPFQTADECLRDAKHPDLIVYHMHQIAPYAHSANGGNNCIRELTEIAPVIILSPIDNPHAMLTALENGARGYIPTASTSLELTIEIIRLVRAGGTFVPASSLSLQMKKREGSAVRATSAEQFTPRQMAVLHYLRLGKANKIIAHELALSEGTVKAHIRNIMKKMGVTNRTEVACRAQTLATFAAT
jgi:DNA-binding NarL/FixJ family response regulator